MTNHFSEKKRLCGGEQRAPLAARQRLMLALNLILAICFPVYLKAMS
jgi:hypothetical protein